MSIVEGFCWGMLGGAAVCAVYALVDLWRGWKAKSERERALQAMHDLIVWAWCQGETSAYQAIWKAGYGDGVAWVSE